MKKLSYMVAFVVASASVHALLFVTLRSPEKEALARVMPEGPRPAPTPPQKKTEAPPPEEAPAAPTVMPPRVTSPSPERIAQVAREARTITESTPTFVYGAALRVKSAP